MDLVLNRPWPYLAVAAFAALIGLYVWRQPHRPGSRYFGRLVGVWLVWALAAAFQTVFVPQELRYSLWVLQSVCALVYAPLELMFVLEYTGNEKWLARRSFLLLFLPSLILAVMAYAMPGSVAWIEVHSGVPVLMGRDVVRWVVFGYPSFLILVSIGVLTACLLRAPAFREPILLIILGEIVPLVGYGVIDAHRLTIAPVQATILIGSVSMLAYFVALYSYRILQVIPVARDMVISHMPYGLLVLDARNRLVDFNAMAQALPGLPGRLSLQQTASQALGSWWEHLAPLIGPEHLAQDVAIVTSASETIFQVSSLPLLQASGWRSGQVFLLEDVTQARQLQQQQGQAQRVLATLQERERLARELHDSLGQTLAAAHLQASTARVLLSQGETARTDECLERLADMTVAAEADVREYLLGVKTAFSTSLRFFSALRQYTLRFGQQYRLRVELSVPPQIEAQGLPAAIEVQLLRIIQEALSNVRKHARAESARVVFTHSGQLVRIAIIDDGQGFDVALAAWQAEGFGLQGMRERAEALGGCFQVISQPGQGTQVVVELPVQVRTEEGGGEVVR